MTSKTGRAENGFPPFGESIKRSRLEEAGINIITCYLEHLRGAK